MSQAHRVSAALSGGRGELLGAFCFPDKKIDLMMNLILVMILNLILNQIDYDIDEYFFIMLLKGLSSENNAMFFSNNRKSPLRVRVVWQHEFRLSMGGQ